jgi:uncharacterized membrane protein
MSDAIVLTLIVSLLLPLICAYSKPTKALRAIYPVNLCFRNLERSAKRLAYIYAVVEGIAVIYSTFSLPPFQVPDETLHWRRSVYVAEGHLFAHRDGNQLGADLPSWVSDLESIFFPVIGQPTRRVTPNMYESAWNIPYESDQIFIGFSK